MPKLKSKVESALCMYLADELNGEEFKERVRAILKEFKGKICFIKTSDS